MRAEQQVGGEPDQAVAPTDLAALDRLEQEIAAPGLDQLQRGGDRGLGIGDLTPPDQRGAAGGECCERRVRRLSYWSYPR
jgi:hypothetical protein